MNKSNEEIAKTIYRRAVEKWGEESQTRQLFEEMAELQVVLCHRLRGNKPELMYRVSDEMADVEIMLEQMKFIFDNFIEVEKIKLEKLHKIAAMLFGV